MTDIPHMREEPLRCIGCEEEIESGVHCGKDACRKKATEEIAELDAGVPGAPEEENGGR